MAHLIVLPKIADSVLMAHAIGVDGVHRSDAGYFAVVAQRRQWDC